MSDSDGSYTLGSEDSSTDDEEEELDTEEVAALQQDAAQAAVLPAGFAPAGIHQATANRAAANEQRRQRAIAFNQQAMLQAAAAAPAPAERKKKEIVPFVFMARRGTLPYPINHANYSAPNGHPCKVIVASLQSRSDKKDQIFRLTQKEEIMHAWKWPWEFLGPEALLRNPAFLQAIHDAGNGPDPGFDAM